MSISLFQLLSLQGVLYNICLPSMLNPIKQYVECKHMQESISTCLKMQAQLLAIFCITIIIVTS